MNNLDYPLEFLRKALSSQPRYLREIDAVLSQMSGQEICSYYLILPIIDKRVVSFYVERVASPQTRNEFYTFLWNRGLFDREYYGED